MCITSTIGSETWNKGSDLWSRCSCLALIHQLQGSTKSSPNAHWRSGSKICPTGWTQVSMRWYFSGPSSFCYRRMWSRGEWGSSEGRTGALKHDLLDLAVLELTARASLIPRVIPFGHKLVKMGMCGWLPDIHKELWNLWPSPAPPWLSSDARSSTQTFLSRRASIVRERSLVTIVGGVWWGGLCLLGSKYAIVLCDDQLWMVLHSHPSRSLGLSFVWGKKGA